MRPPIFRTSFLLALLIILAGARPSPSIAAGSYCPDPAHARHNGDAQSIRIGRGEAHFHRAGNGEGESDNPYKSVHRIFPQTFECSNLAALQPRHD
jgi:hypothetical protein